MPTTRPDRVAPPTPPAARGTSRSRWWPGSGHQRQDPRRHRRELARDRDGDPGRDHPSNHAHERGQATILVAAVVVLAAVVTLGVGRLGSAAVERARARTAADAAALAAVVDEADGAGAGRRRADAVAGANGATVVAYRVDGTAVEVEVRLGGAHATSRADRFVAEPGQP